MKFCRSFLLLRKIKIQVISSTIAITMTHRSQIYTVNILKYRINYRTWYDSLNFLIIERIYYI